MGIKSTQTITREYAISQLRIEMLRPLEAEIEFKLSQLSNEDLEAMMDEIADDFTNYWVVDKIEE